MDRAVILSSVLGLHLAAAIIHGSSHALVPVNLGPFLNGLVFLTVFLGPVVGVVLVRRNHPLGIPLFTISMAGALVIGGTLHFLVENPDHVAELPASPVAFALPSQCSGGVRHACNRSGGRSLVLAEKGLKEIP